MDNIQMTQEEKSRKKFLVPLIVLLLCAVSLTGAAYAYSSSVTVVDNSASIEGLTIALIEKNDQDQDVNVAHALYNLKLAYGDHYLIGSDSAKKAIKYSVTENSVGFKANGAYAVVTAADLGTLSTFKDGYYVDVSYDVGEGFEHVGYNSVTFEAELPTVEELVAAIGHGVYKVGSEYTLNVTNQSNKNVDLKLNVKYDSTEVSLGDNVAMYVAITGNVDDGVAVNKVIRIDNPTSGLVSDSVTSILADQAADGTDIKVQAYLACSDYCSAEATAVTSTSYGFVVNFTASTA